MLNLLLAIASSALVSLTMRLSGGKIRNNIAMLMVNYLLCAGLAALYITPGTAGLGFAAGAGLINGVLYLAGFVLLQQNVRTNGVVLSSTFLKLGLLVSWTFGWILFLAIGEITGFALGALVKYLYVKNKKSK